MAQDIRNLFKWNTCRRQQWRSTVAQLIGRSFADTSVITQAPERPTQISFIDRLAVLCSEDKIHIAPGGCSHPDTALIDLMLVQHLSDSLRHVKASSRLLRF